MSYVAERVHTDPRLRRRRKAVTRSRRRKLFVRISALLAFVALVWAVMWSPLLHVRDVQLRGAQQTSAAEVIDALQLGSGTNILRLSTTEVQTSVEELPWVKEASVTRVLPGTIRIKIEERTAALVLSLGAANWLVDRGGRVLAPGKRANLPVLAGADVDGIQVGTELEAAQLTGGLRVYRSLAREVRIKVAAIFAPTPERITLALTDGSQVRFGAAELLKAKSSVLASLLRRLAREGTAASYIDLRVPTSPAVSPVVQPAAPATTAAVPSTTVEETEPAEPGTAEISPTDATVETEIPDGASPVEDGDAPAETRAAD